MYRYTNNIASDLTSICNIYNDITDRNRTKELHHWEWFKSPYENKSYVILDKEEKILGHHGILSIKLNYKNSIYSTGKTENTIMIKGYGPLYFKNEMAMHKEYINDYDILITTTAHGVTKKIREKLGYKVFGTYVTFIRIVDFKILSVKVNNSILKRVINFLSPMLNIFLLKSKISKVYKEEINNIEEVDLVKIDLFYNEIKDNFKFSQIRSEEFLRYKILINPYIDFSILKLYNDNSLCGYLIFSINDNKVSIEDILFLNDKIKQELLNRLFNYIKSNKLGYTIVLTTLENSPLDSKYNAFLRRVNNSEGSDKLMIKNNIKDKIKDDLKIENFYFTKLMMEGIQ